MIISITNFRFYLSHATVAIKVNIVDLKETPSFLLGQTMCQIIFTTFSRAVSPFVGAAMICLAWMSSAVFYRVVSRFLARPVERKCYPCDRKTRSDHCSRQLFIQGHGSGNSSIVQLHNCDRNPSEPGREGPTSDATPSLPDSVIIIIIIIISSSIP